VDLFCGAGGAAVGYHRAGFDEIVGIDIKPQPRYPFPFVQADALEFCKSFGAGFDVIHASPPCQEYSSTKNLTKSTYGRMIPVTRVALKASGRPFVIENVAGARKELHQPFRLDGRDFSLGILGYGLKRERWFEVSPLLPLLIPARQRERALVNVIGKRLRIMPDHPGPELSYHRFRAEHGITDKFLTEQSQASEAMGLDLPLQDLAQAIPPAYTEFIGKQLIAALSEARPPT
jgi:DNA (cytosine-5)-methyltransferase 1